MNTKDIVNTRARATEDARVAFVGALRVYLGDQFAVRGPFQPEQDGGYDFRIVLGGREPADFLVQVKDQPYVTREELRHVIWQAGDLTRRHHAHVLLFAPLIREEQAEELRKAGIFYLDRAGNAYLRVGRQRILVDVRGRRPQERVRAEPGRLVEPTGLKVIHLLLTRPTALNLPYRTMAEQAGVALGTVGVVMRELEQRGYLALGPEKRRMLQKRDDLLELFVRGYALKLRPACFIGRYRHEERDPEKLWERLTLRLDRMKVRHALTGALADHFLTRHLTAETVTLHVERGAEAAWRPERMLPDPREGNLILLDFFAPTVVDDRKDRERIATPLLVYAELLHDGRPRDLETAKMLFDTYLKEPSRGR